MGLPEFAQIEDGDFETAFAAALAAHLAEIETMANDTAPASFENTINALESAGVLLKRVSGIFWNLTGADTNDSLQALERALSPRFPGTTPRS